MKYLEDHRCCFHRAVPSLERKGSAPLSINLEHHVRHGIPTVAGDAAIPSGTIILVEGNLSLEWVAKIHLWESSTVSRLRPSFLVTSDREPHSNCE